MAQPVPEIGVGTLLAGTYEVTKLIGQGGMGAVYAAEHKRLPGKRVAVKVLLGAKAEGEQLARFRREAEVASRLGHPNIVEVLDFNATPDGTPYMVLEFLEGESLAARLKREGRIALAETLAIARQVGSALAAAHKNMVVHRDLKPDNIYLCPTDSGGVISERVKVLDFGISKIRGSSTVQTQESALLGTPQYMSPEQAHGHNSKIDGRADIWALGVILYEMLSGAPPFTGETLAQVLLKIVNDAPAPLAGVPDDVARAVMRALEKEPTARHPDVASFIGELTGQPLVTRDQMPVRVPTPVDAMAATAAQSGATHPSVGTQPRGEIVSVPPTHHQATKPPSRMPLYAGVGLAAAGLAAAGAMYFLREPAPKPIVLGAGQVYAQNDSPSPPPPAAAPPAAAPPAAAPPAEPPVVAMAPPPARAAAGAGAATAKGASRASASSHEGLSPAAKADLDAAESALTGGKLDEAMHLARRALTTQKSSQAFALIARIYCKQGDLGNAKATLRSVGSGQQAAVVHACAKDGVDLK